MTHPVKMVDRGLHWEEKGMDVSQPYYTPCVCISQPPCVCVVVS